MDETSARQAMRRALSASTGSRALVTAVLPAIAHGMQQGSRADTGLSEVIGALASDPAYREMRVQVSEALRALGIDELDPGADFALLMSAAQTAVFVVQCADLLGEDPSVVWRRYVEQMVSTEAGLAS